MLLFLALFAPLSAHAQRRGHGQGQTPGPAPQSDPEPITPVPAPPPADPRKVALGERLFEDPRLSHDNSRSCSTCHDVTSNGASTGRDSNPFDERTHKLDTLTVFNAGLSFRFNWAGRFRTLEAQAAASLVSPGIMGSSADEAIAKLRLDASVVAQFQAAYGHQPDSASLLNAIVTFEQSLVTPGSRFDLWLAGDSNALTAAELDGYRLFKSLGCVSCHQGVNVGGNLFERHGIFRPLAPGEPFVLRVPSLRNVATTPPYFHNGSAATLQEAVRKMGLAQLNADLTDQQIEAIVAFLRSLTGTYRGRPVGAAR